MGSGETVCDMFTHSNKQTNNKSAQVSGTDWQGTPEASSGGKCMFASWCVVSRCYTAARAQTLTWMKFIVSELFLSKTDFKNKELTREDIPQHTRGQ